MAEAKQCDRCGALYKEHYNAASMNIDNGESVIYIVARYNNRKLDLCEECTKLFERFMNNKRIEINEKPKLVEDPGFVQYQDKSAKVKVCNNCKHYKGRLGNTTYCKLGNDCNNFNTWEPDEYYEEDET